MHITVTDCTASAINYSSITTSRSKNEWFWSRI